MNDTFATVLNCMDGRVQVPVCLYLVDRFGVDHIDTITEAGIVRYLSDQTGAPHTLATLESITVSVERHGSTQIAVVAHDDCAGNPRPPEEQIRQLHVAVDFVRSQFQQCEVIGLWVNLDEVVHEVA